MGQTSVLVEERARLILSDGAKFLRMEEKGIIVVVGGTVRYSRLFRRECEILA